MSLTRTQMYIVSGLLVIMTLAVILASVFLFGNKATPTATSAPTANASARLTVTPVVLPSLALPTPTPRVPRPGEVLSALTSSAVPTPSAGQIQVKNFWVTTQTTIKDIKITASSTARVFPNPTLTQTYNCTVVMYAGIQMTDFTEKNIAVNSVDTVTITLPAAKILGAEGETIYSSETSVFNCVLEKEDCTAACIGIGLQEKNETRKQAEIEARRVAQDTAIKQGLLNRALEEVKKNFEALLKRLDFKEIIFKT
jgi:Protein of unknown function (DUF4230)